MNKNSPYTRFICAILFSWLILFHGGHETYAGEGRDFEAWLDSFREEAMKAGISAATLEKTLDGITYNTRVIELDRNQPEFTLTLSEYLDNMVSAARIDKGRRELAANRQLLETIEHRYGVAPHYLVALWGLESYYCSYTGKFPILEALATLTFDPRRSLFFKKELLAALHLVDDRTISLEDLKGSWAGALGCLQFLPSIFREYGVDFDRDGRLDVFTAGGDLFASAANYLQASGWQNGGSWGAEVTIAGPKAGELPDDRSPRPVSFWLQHGVVFQDREKQPDGDTRAALIQPGQQKDRSFLIYENFEVLLKWNRSDYYALAAGLLAERIKSGE